MLDGIGSILSGAVDVVKLLGARKARKNAEEAAEEAVQYQKDKGRVLDDWYNRNFYADATQRADAQQLLNRMGEQIRKRNNDAAAMAAVAGASGASLAAGKAANNMAMARAVSQVAADGAGRKDRVADAYMQGRLAQNDALSDIEMQRSKNSADAAKALAATDVDTSGIEDLLGEMGLGK